MSSWLCSTLYPRTGSVQGRGTSRRASRRRPPIGGSRPQGAALITRPCNTVSLSAALASKPLYRASLPPIYIPTDRPTGLRPPTRATDLCLRPPPGPTGCKPTAILTTGNTDTLLSTLAEEKKNREKRRIRFYYCPSSTREQEESAARDNTFNRYSLLPPPFVSRIFSNLDDKLGGNETKKRASIEEEEEDAADTRQIRCEIGIARMRTLRNRRFNLTVRSWCAPLSWSVGVAGRSRVGFADHDDGRS